MTTFYWLDYETVGADPAADWPAQFAGVRTDINLNEIGTPLNIYCKLPSDRLPHPEACMITGLDPHTVNEKGLIEPEFIKRIHHELMHPKTCAVGYNSIRFDDEVTRHSLYRNFYDPYAREWKNGNSRWDLIDLVRLTAALRPAGINWPIRDDGYNSFRLEDLTQANGLEHGNAHDAIADVRATIALAKLIKNRQPKVYDYVFNHKGKHKVASLLDMSRKKAVIHVSGMFSAERHCLALVMPLAEHPTNRNGIIVYDLSVDPEALLSLSVQEIQEQLFQPQSKRANNSQRIPLKVIHINKCPVIAPLQVLKPKDCKRLGLDLIAIERNRQILLVQKELGEKLKKVFTPRSEKISVNPDLMLYSGGFFSPSDRERMQQIITIPPEKLIKATFSFVDKRLEEMLFRYKARYFTDLLNDKEADKWREFCIAQLTESGERSFGFAIFIKELQQIKQQALTQNKQILLSKVESYARDLAATLDIKLTDYYKSK